MVQICHARLVAAVTAALATAGSSHGRKFLGDEPPGPLRQKPVVAYVARAAR